MEDQEFVIMVKVKAASYKAAINKIPDEIGEVVGGMKPKPPPDPKVQAQGGGP